MKGLASTAEGTPRLPRSPEGTENVWHQFWRIRQAHANTPGVRARVTLTEPERAQRQFLVEMGSGHHFLVDDADGVTGSKPIELVAAAMAGCTASDVITILRGKKRQQVTAYEVRVEATQAERPPQVFVAVRVHHIVSGHDIDPAAVSEAIRISEDKYCMVAAMLKHTAVITTTFEVVNEPAPQVQGV